jgi:prepilin-type N-terminal cleavage/methylation domain-containing protein
MLLTITKRYMQFLPAISGGRAHSYSDSVLPVEPRPAPRRRTDRGFSLVELLIVVMVAAIISAIAIPQVLAALKAYRLHGNASAISAQLNVARFRATSQYSPYRMNVIAGTTPPTFSMERLCGTDTDCQPPAGPCLQSYAPYLQADIESGAQYLSSGISFTTTNPGGAVLPPSLGGTGAGSTVFYFNTRGLPVDCSGTTLANGGAVIYLKNSSNLTDAVVVSVGGRIGVYSWSPQGNSWVAR